MVREIYSKIDCPEEISPCPFCGQPAELWLFTPNDYVNFKVVMCTNMADEDEGEDIDVDGCPMNFNDNMMFHKPTRREAIAAWNTRADSPKEK